MRRRLLAGLLIVLLVGCARAEVVLRVAVDSSSGPSAEEALSAYEATAQGVSFATWQENHESALEALQTGQLDFALLFLPPDTSAPFQAPVGVEALVLIVHPDNLLDGITMTQAREIFSGQVLDWTALGGPAGPIHVVAREEGSDARRVFQSLVLEDQPCTSSARLATSGEHVLEIVSENPLAIGYVVLSALDERVKPLALGGIMPSPESAQSGEYPLIGQVMFVAQAEPEGPARAFLTWMMEREQP